MLAPECRAAAPECRAASSRQGARAYSAGEPASRRRLHSQPQARRAAPVERAGGGYLALGHALGAHSGHAPKSATPLERENPAIGGAFRGAGGGTRTPDTRIMIPQRFGSAKPRIEAGGHKRGRNWHRAWLRVNRPTREAIAVEARRRRIELSTMRATTGCVRTQARRPSCSATNAD
jgi:hypothetical protein